VNQTPARDGNSLVRDGVDDIQQRTVAARHKQSLSRSRYRPRGFVLWGEVTLGFVYAPNVSP
ncbi:hypothetical protein, partial [Alicyclobacillus suci]|uniref:hypothetical protein n=1 Tax=Alicyclobacillus suci TaxID=2816080 RepID=UPI001F36F271